MLKALQDAATHASETGMLRIGTPVSSEWFPTSQLLASREWFPEEGSAVQAQAPEKGRFSITAADEPTVENVSNIAANCTKGVANHGDAADESASKSYGQAIPHRSAQPEVISQLQQQIASLQAERVIMRREIAEANGRASAPSIDPVSTPQGGKILQAAQQPTTHRGEERKRIHMLQDKVARQAAELVRLRSTCEAAVMESSRLRQRIDELQQARLEADALVEELRIECRLSKRCSFSPLVTAANPSDEHCQPSAAAPAQYQDKNEELKEQISLLQEELTRVRESGNESMRAATATATAAEAKVLLAEADIKSLKSQLASVRQKAREMLEQKDKEMRALQRRSIPVHVTDKSEACSTSEREEARAGAELNTNISAVDNRRPPDPMADNSSNGLETLHQYAVLQARLEGELQRERLKSQALEKKVDEMMSGHNAQMDRCITIDRIKHLIIKFMQARDEEAKDISRLEIVEALHLSEAELSTAQVQQSTASGNQAQSMNDLEQLRSELREATRRYIAAEGLLEKAEQQLREQPSSTGISNLAYLRHVVSSYLALGDGEESAALFQVIATFLQFDETEVMKIQAVRQRKAAAQAGIFGQATSYFWQR